MPRKAQHIITVYEHDCVKYDSGFYGQKITQEQFQALEQYHGAGVPYFKLINKGVQFNEFVGVIQVGGLTVEVLPKIDRLNAGNDWRSILLNMLRNVGIFNIASTSTANLKIRSNSILDLYFELFLNETEAILHKGLIKKYRRIEENQGSLKGSLNFTEHIKRNIVHQERFFVNHTIFDRENPLNKVLYKTLKLIQSVNTNTALQSKVGALLLNFPEMPDIYVDEDWFDRVSYNRKTETYRKALEISKLLLLQYHPAISSGRHHVLALMFDMNLLWEQFVYVSLKKHLGLGQVRAQTYKPYYSLKGHQDVKLQPDIHIITPNGGFIIDTKWKLPVNGKPAHTDLQQMYAYTKYFNSAKTILCYPGAEDKLKEGVFHQEADEGASYPCSVVTIGLEGYGSDVSGWMRRIGERMGEVLDLQLASNGN